MTTSSRLRPKRGVIARNACLSWVMLGIATCAQSQAELKPVQDYTSRQTFKGQAFFKDTNIWVYSDSFANQFGMPKEGISLELKGVEAAAFRLESSLLPSCGFGGKADACMPDTQCMLDLYVDEAKHPLPWQEPEQKAGWVNRYSSMFWIKPVEDMKDVVERDVGMGALHPFVDKVNRRLPFYHAKTDSDFKNPTQIGWGKYRLRTMGYRRYIVGSLTLLTLSLPCGNYRGDQQVSAHYLYLTGHDRGEPVEPYFHQATLPRVFTDRMQALRAQASSAFIQSIKSAVPALAPILEGDKK